jgi:hypothetical protein
MLISARKVLWLFCLLIFASNAAADSPNDSLKGINLYNGCRKDCWRRRVQDRQGLFEYLACVCS